MYVVVVKTSEKADLAILSFIHKNKKNGESNISLCGEITMGNGNRKIL